MSKELRPCPFCGGEAFYIKIMGNYEKPHEIYCSKCDGAITEGRSEKQVVTNWNTRPIEDALNARIAELEAEQRWIPVGERLPEVGVDVFTLVYDANDSSTSVNVLTYYGDGKWFCWDTGCYVVTHWKPIPKPPEATHDR